MVGIIFVFLLSGIALSDADLPEQVYERQAILNKEGVLLEWRAFGDEQVEFQIRVPTTNGQMGWFGLGFTPTGGMKGADIVVGWIDEEGVPHLEDRFATGQQEPFLDKHQDYTLLGTKFEDSQQLFRFSRKLVTCDPHDMILNNETVRLIYASNPTKPIQTGSGFGLIKHVPSSKVLKSLFLFDDSDQNPIPGEKLITMNFLMTEHVIPPVETTYWCEVMKFQELDNLENLHMIGYSPIIHGENEDVVHHLLLYICLPTITATFPKNRSFDCDRDTEGVEKYCQNMFGVWAKGGGAIYFPDNVAYSVKTAVAQGGYMMMQMHYDNPQAEVGRVDKSGLEVFFIDQPREHNAGSIRFGSGGFDWTVAIPPLQDSWMISTECSTECFTKKLPKDGVNIVMMGPHTHLLGVKVIAHQIRNGTEIDRFIKDENYDFNYQQLKSFKKPKVLLPGDTVITDCVFSSVEPTRRTVMTYGGESTREEMCLVFGYYYPAQNFVSCLSSTRSRELAREYGWNGVGDADPRSSEMYALIDKFDWSEANRTRLHNYIKSGPQTVNCFGVDMIDPTARMSIPRISSYVPLVEPDLCAEETTQAPAPTQPLLTMKTTASQTGVTVSTTPGSITTPLIHDSTGATNKNSVVHVLVLICGLTLLI